ncbi:MAG: outer membrane protein assembly factor BamA [Candidatus Poribacteria bacterium]
MKTFFNAKCGYESILILGLYFLFLGINPIFAQDNSTKPNRFAIKSIQIQGSKTMPAEAIVSILQTRVGDEISKRKLKDDVQELYKLGQFSNIQVDAVDSSDGISLTFLMEEWPKVSGDISINGNNEINTGKIKDVLTIGSNRSLSGTALQENKNKILNLYKQKGFYLAQVEPNVVPNPEDGTARVAFDITEGKKITIQEIDIVGNRRISDREIRKQMKLKKGKRFDDLLYDGDLVTVVDYYRQNGFTNAKLIKADKEFNDAKTGIVIHIELEEGPQYRIGNIDVKVEPFENSKPIYSKKNIVSQLIIEKGDILKEADLIDAIRRIHKMYLDKGRVAVQIKPDIKYDPEQEIADINLLVAEGNVAYIGSVPINWVSETNDEPHKTKEYVIRRELDRYGIKEGKLYSYQNIEDARRKILNLGPFIKRAEPQIDVQDESPDPNAKAPYSQKVTINFDVEESRQSGMFSIAGGYGSEGGLFGALDIWDDNIFGRAFRIQVRGEMGTKELRTGQLVFSSPWMLNTPTSLDASIYSTRRSINYIPGDTNEKANYRDDSVGASVTVGRPITRKINLGLGLRNENTTYKQWDASISRYLSPEEWYRNNVHPEPTEAQLQSLPTAYGRTRSIKFSINRDTRNYLTSMFDPNGGSAHNLSAEFSGLGGDVFHKVLEESSIFIPTWWKLVLVFHTQFGYMGGRDAKYLRFERFYLGGIRSVRGYAQYSITPSYKDDKDKENYYAQYGGNRMGLLNIEYRFPIASMLRGIIFFDAGQTWGGTQSALKNFRSVKTSAGLGVRFDFMGALARLEYAKPLAHNKNWKLEFDIGPSF